MRSTLGIAFCGSGRIVRGHHLPAIEKRSDQYHVAGFYDIVATASAACAGDRYRVFPSLDALVSDASVDVVVVATKPLETHHAPARLALEAGKHVLLEKPMAQDSAVCDDLIALARRQQRCLTVHHNRRLDLDFLALQAMIRSGELGEPRLIATAVGSGYDGDFVDWGVHLVDQALQLNPAPLREVSAIAAHPDAGPNACGYLEITLRFARGPVTRISKMPRMGEFLSNGTPAAARFIAYGTLGSFAQRVIEDPRDLMNATQNFDRIKPEYAVPDFLRIERREFYDDLYDAIVHGAPLPVSPESARNAIRVIELANESMRTNAAVAATGMIEST